TQMMLGEPDAVEACRLGVPRGVQGIGERLGLRRLRRDGAQIHDRQLHGRSLFLFTGDSSPVFSFQHRTTPARAAAATRLWPDTQLTSVSVRSGAATGSQAF